MTNLPDEIEAMAEEHSPVYGNGLIDQTNSACQKAFKAGAQAMLAREEKLVAALKYYADDTHRCEYGTYGFPVQHQVDGGYEYDWDEDNGEIAKSVLRELGYGEGGGGEG